MKYSTKSIASGILVAFFCTAGAVAACTGTIRYKDCIPDCEGKACGEDDGCGDVCEAGSGCISCTPECEGKACGEDDGCGDVCEAGSGCISCTPECEGKACGEDDGCGDICEYGSGCICTPECEGKACGEDDGCGDICEHGSGCICTPDCEGKACGEDDGCGDICEYGSGCICTPDCEGKACGEDDGCGDICEYGSGCICMPDCHLNPCGQADDCGGICQPGSGCILQGSEPSPALSDAQELFWTCNISPWPVTITINSAGMHWIKHYDGNEDDPGLVRVDVVYDSYDRIPLHHFYEGGEYVPNPHNVNLQIGILRYYQGVLIYGTVDYLRVGQFSKEVGVAHKWKFMPQQGETIWIVVSTLSRPPYELGTVGPEGESYYERSWAFPVTVP